MSQNLSLSTYGMADLIPRFVELMDDDSNPNLQFEVFFSNYILVRMHLDVDFQPGDM